MYFRNYGLCKRWLDKCVKNPVSVDPSTSNMVNGPKHCCNVEDGSFTLFIDHSEHNSVGKSLLEWYAKYWDCLLRHWFPMASILFLIETNQRYEFRYYYLRNKRLFLHFFLHFWKLHEILKFSENRMTLIADVFPI